MTPSTADKVAFLLKAENYPGQPAAVESIETHFAWLFLTDRRAYKLKKPVHFQLLDFRTVAAREHDCREELRLNRRLAAGVYLDVVPLVLDRAGNMRLGGSGRCIDWLVRMRRLPAELSLESLIRSAAVPDEELRTLVMKLVEFYRRAEPADFSGAQYRKRLRARIEATLEELSRDEFELDRKLVQLVSKRQHAFLENNSSLLDERAHRKKIVEAHGDLRLEHIFLGPGLGEPVIIDCLEFSRDLRILDCVEELAFLALECERMSAAEVGERVMAWYREESGDEAPESLAQFYKSLRACVRAELSVWHRLDPQIDDSPHWTLQAMQYLELARDYLAN